MIDTLHKLYFFNFLSTYIFTGIIPIIGFIFTSIYLKGYIDNKNLNESKEKGNFNINEYRFNPSFVLFKNTNKLLDLLIKYLHKGILKSEKLIIPFLEKAITDNMIEKLLGMYFGKKNGIENLSFKSRVELAKIEFDTKENAFWWAQERAPHFRNISPVISGRWFNGKPVENYLPFLTSARSFYQVIRSGVLVFFVSFAVICAVYHPKQVFGYQAGFVVKDHIVAVASNDSLWSGVGENDRLDKAVDMVTSANGYSNIPFGFLFLDGYLTKLLLALAISLVFIKKSYYANFKKLNVPFIRDTHEEFAFEARKTEIDLIKRIWASGNIKATEFDRNAPLIQSFTSTGSFERKNVIGAKRKGEKIYQSLDDKAQHTLFTGATGTNKSRCGILPEAKAWFEIGNIFYAQNMAYSEIFDLRQNTLTQKAISEGYLKEYKPLPNNPVSISMTIFDIKSQLWKDLKPIADKLNLGDKFIVFGPDILMGQYSLDLLKGMNPDKLVAVLESISGQMGGESKKDFWLTSSLQWIKRFGDVIYLYSRTIMGRDWMKVHRKKIWSLSFLQDIVVYDANAQLLSEALSAIQHTLDFAPERFSDIFNLEAVNSIGLILTQWKTMSEGQKDGIVATMTSILAGFDNTKLESFMTGVGDNVLEISQLWNKISAFDLGNEIASKLVLLFAKTKIFEEAINRQQRYSRRIVEISNIYYNAYPDKLTLESAVELIPFEWRTGDGQDLVREFAEKCLTIATREEEIWELGEYKANLLAKLGQYEEYDLYGINLLVQQALTLQEKILELEPRYAKKAVSIANLDPTIFKENKSDTPELARQKEEHLKMYYEFKDAKTRVSREYMLFMGDEYQELITVDKTGVIWCDNNLPGVARSARIEYCVATQSISSFVQKVGKEVTDVFVNNMRNKIFLPNEDKATRDMVVALAGKTSIFSNPFKLASKGLLNDTKQTGYEIYDNFNYFISDSILKNKALAGIEIDGHRVAYPYDYDIFTKGEALDVDYGYTGISNIFSSIFDIKTDYPIPSMKNHFLDTSKIVKFRETGSDSQGENNNQDALQSSRYDATRDMNNAYQDFLTKNYQKDVPLLSEDEFGSQGNIHAFVNLQVAGTTINDHVIIASEDDYLKSI